MVGANGAVCNGAGEVPASLLRLAELRDRQRSKEAADQPTSLEAAIAARMAAPVEGVSIADRLERKFGLGQEPKKRRELYSRLQRLLEREGDAAYAIVSQCVAEAVSAKRPDRYFTSSVVRRLREAGFTLGPGVGGDPSW